MDIVGLIFINMEYEIITDEKTHNFTTTAGIDSIISEPPASALELAEVANMYLFLDSF